MSSASLGLVIDIDGVLVRGTTLIPGSNKALEKLKASNVPFVLLSNSSGVPFDNKVAILNESLSIKIDKTNLVLAHTPFGTELDYLKEKNILLIGRKEEYSTKIARDAGFTLFKTADELVRNYPTICPLSSLKKGNPSVDSSHGHEEGPFEAIVILGEPFDWILSIQVALDVLINGGYLTPRSEGEEVRQPPPIWLANPDFDYKTTHPSPRLTSGAFFVCIQALYKHKTGKDIQCNYFGKPHPPVYNAAKSALQHQAPGVVFDKIYAIGDNPLSDIMGANREGDPFISVLVRTGCFQGEDNDPLHPAKIVCTDFAEAIEMIIPKQSSDDL